MSKEQDEDQSGKKPGGQSPEKPHQGNTNAQPDLDPSARQANADEGTGMHFAGVRKRRRIAGKQSVTLENVSTLETPPPKRACLGVAMPRERCTYAANTLQPEDAGGHLLFSIASAGLLFCWKCGAYSKDRTHMLRGCCKQEPGSGQAYRLNRLKNSRHPLTGASFADRPKRLLV